MKKWFVGIFLVIWMLGGLPVANAAPERLQIKDSQKRTKEQAAVAQIKSINVDDIEDPAARKAIKEILNYLGLKPQSSVPVKK